MSDLFWWAQYRRIRNRSCPKCEEQLYVATENDVRLCMHCDWVEPDEVRERRIANREGRVR
jgi:ribosomal protein S27AE